MFARPLLMALSLAGTSLALAEAGDHWHLETMRLKNGAVLQGIVLFDFRGQVDFAEIQRPAGKPMYAVVRSFRAQEIQAIERHGEAEHRQLLDQFRAFRQRTELEAVHNEQLKLDALEADGATIHRYRGSWFTLLSTADEETTRRCATRIERLFFAYRSLWPPQVATPETLTIELYGSFDAYRRKLKEWDLTLNSPAFFSPHHHRILAGCELDGFARQLNEVKADHQHQLASLNRVDAELVKTLAKLTDDLRQAGFNEEEIASEIRQRRAAWKQELATARARIQEIDRRNEFKFSDVTRKMFRRLAHEAWHAYLETYVCPRELHRVPTWLNEGLAQVFETGQLEGDYYRLDAPDPERLAALRSELTANTLSLAQVITSDEAAFLKGHGGVESQRHYLYAWGLAWYLAIGEARLGGDTLRRYLTDDEEPPIPRFERLTGAKLSEFERRWRQAMLEPRKP